MYKHNNMLYLYKSQLYIVQGVMLGGHGVQTWQPPSTHVQTHVKKNYLHTNDVQSGFNMHRYDRMNC